jgi:lysyl-tRNA synthetase class 2
LKHTSESYKQYTLKEAVNGWYNFYCLSFMAKPVFTTKSSTIHKVDYNEKEKAMEIEFRSGNTYRYYDVPPRMWKIFQLYIECEGSAGSFFNEYIKNQFTSEKLAAGSADEDENN